jgi:hypothetical protein
MKAALIFSCSTASIQPSADHGVTNTEVAPTRTAGWNMMFSAATWNSGVTMPTTSVSVRRSSTTTVWAVISRARWFIRTPLGRPVVPPV